MEKIVFLGEAENNAIERVYALNRKTEIEALGECVDAIIDCKNVNEYAERLKTVEYAFSTWGMPRFSAEEYRKYFPSLKCVFYAAGTVKDFAKPAFDCGIRVFSSRFSNALPVAETVFAQIILANKGFFSTLSQKTYEGKKSACAEYSGNFAATVGIIGIGAIGALLIEKLKTLDLNIVVWDKFMSDGKAREMGVKKVDLLTLFRSSNVITNHLADKPETEGILDYRCFTAMKDNAVFINSGRGKQVNEQDLIRALKENKTRFALLDVTYPEPPLKDNELLEMDNVIITPHIDGSSGNEAVRMADEMIEAFKAVTAGRESKSEIFEAMLASMA